MTNNNWQTRTINNFSKVVSGSTPRTSEPSYWNGEIGWVTPNDLSKLKNKYIERGERNITEIGLKNCSAELIPANSLIMSSRAPIGYFAISTKPVATNQGCKSFVTDNSVEIEFLYYALNHYINSIKRLGSGSTFAEVGKKQLESLSIQIPSKQTQLKIANILSSVDEAIQKTDQIIQKSEELKHGLMQQLFTRGIDWKVMPVKEFAQVKGGKRLPKGARFAEEKTKHPYIRVTDFDQGTVHLNNLKYISKDLHEKIKRYIINKEDIFISIAGSIGFVGIIPDELDGANLTENAAKIILNQKNVIQKYLYYFLISPHAQNYFNKVVSKSGQPKLALFKIEDLKVPVPPINEQNRIAEILFAVDEKISVNKKINAKLTLLKEGLMQDIFNKKVGIN